MTCKSYLVLRLQFVSYQSGCCCCAKCIHQERFYQSIPTRFGARFGMFSPGKQIPTANSACSLIWKVPIIRITHILNSASLQESGGRLLNCPLVATLLVAVRVHPKERAKEVHIPFIGPERVPNGILMTARRRHHSRALLLCRVGFFGGLGNGPNAVVDIVRVMSFGWR